MTNKKIEIGIYNSVITKNQGILNESLIKISDLLSKIIVQNTESIQLLYDIKNNII